MAKKVEIELLLSILLAVSISYALTLFIEFDDITWLFMSSVSIVVTIFMIYHLLELKMEKFIDFFKLLSFSLLILLPFSLGKAWRLKIMAEKGIEGISGLWWNMNGVLIHMMLIGFSFILQGFFESDKKKAKNLHLIGGAAIILSLIFFVGRYGNSLK